jgi:putative ABC transport system ATP-binding protein
LIRLSKVSKHYEGKRGVTALRDIDIDIPPGETIAIVGASGSGKSTLLNLMGALDRPTVGSIEVDGVGLSGLSDRDLTAIRRDKIGFIFQFFNLLPSLTAIENVAIPLHLRGWRPKEALARATELLSLVNLSDRTKHLPEELSGGERQRVAIARALSIYPPILLADEPTGNLDTHSSSEILQLILNLQQQLLATVVIVTHDPQIAKACSRIITIRDGQIVKEFYRAGLSR